MTALATGGISDDVSQATAFPYVWYEVRERDVRGFGRRGLPEVELRVHAYSQLQGMREAQAIIKKAIKLLRDQSLTFDDYTHCGQVFYDETVSLPNEVINGVKVQECVGMFRLYVEEITSG